MLAKITGRSQKCARVHALTQPYVRNQCRDQVFGALFMIGLFTMGAVMTMLIQDISFDEHKLLTGSPIKFSEYKLHLTQNIGVTSCGASIVDTKVSNYSGNE